MTTKYQPLYRHLKVQSLSSIKLTFAEIEGIIGDTLPESAKRHSAWWANETSSRSGHVQCYAWRDAGFEASPNLASRMVTFHRLGR